jgi:hypothetical protein
MGLTKTCGHPQALDRLLSGVPAHALGGLMMHNATSTKSLSFLSFFLVILSFSFYILRPTKFY